MGAIILGKIKEEIDTIFMMVDSFTIFHLICSVNKFG